MKQIGLTRKHALVYEKLINLPEATPLILARETKLNRSSLYRYLEELRSKGLAELILAGKSSRYQADPQGLSQYMLAEESKLERMKQEVPKLVAELREIKTLKKHSTEVKYYRGVEGLRQMLWNVVQTKGEFVGLGYENWNTSVGKAYAEKLRNKMMSGGVKSREISNDPDDGFSYTLLGQDYQAVYAHRRIPPKLLKVKHDTYIYDDVFAYYYHSRDEFFGVEIHNAEIAATERQVFEILWKLAK